MIAYKHDPQPEAKQGPDETRRLSMVYVGLDTEEARRLRHALREATRRCNIAALLCALALAAVVAVLSFYALAAG